MTKRAAADPDTARGKAAREAILAAGTALFARNGLKATSISQIADRAGVNRAMIAYYFGNKAGLYDAIIDSAVAEAAATIASVDLAAGGRESLRQLVLAFADANSRHADFVRMIIHEYFEPGRLFDPSPATKLAGFMKLTKGVLDSLPRAPGARDYDVQVLHLIIVGAINYFILTEPFRQRTAGRNNPAVTTPSMDEFAATLADIFSAGLSHLWKIEG